MDQMSRPGELREVGPVSSSKGYGLLPAETPLAMPTQPLHLPPTARKGRDRLTWPRALLLSLAGIAIAAFARLLYQVLSVVQLTTLQGVFLVLCTMCFAWIALGTSSAILGFFTTMRHGRNAVEFDATAAQGVRTALLFPVYQEDTARIAATIECIARELIALGAEKRFDIFVLSDSRLGDIKARELRAVRFLRRRLRDACPIYYRCRAQNLGKKAGNIADWVQRFGSAYESFIILDADSIMSGGLLAHLQSLMAVQPKAGLIQTVPRLVGAETLFARLQQFAVSLYGPVVAAGFAAWYQHSGNYWGHNAIVRTRAFADADRRCRARPPLGAGKRAASAHRRHAWPALGQPPASRHGRLRLFLLGAVGPVSAGWCHPVAAERLHAAGVFPGCEDVVSGLAGHRPDQVVLPFSRYPRRAVAAQGLRDHGGDAASSHRRAPTGRG